ncbi:MAG: phosphoribosyl-ATP diphosphatase [Planctomycetes bacterium]|nr:phosphoribosyl-ATP diphosphatase [Planctomycetota bacterium]
MILPSIDLQGGCAVQLRSGRDLVLDAGDPWPWLQRFARVGEVAVVDLDAALGRGDHRALIREMCAAAPIRVGGGIRDVDAALAWLDAGATKVVLGTMAQPALLRQLPKDRVVAALDAVHGEVVVDGWRTRTGRTVHDRIAELRPFVSGFLVTFVEREGQLAGLDLDAVRSLRAAAGDAELVIAGGVATPQDVAELDRLGCQAQVGMALYREVFHEADALVAMLPVEQPWPTVVCDERGAALGLCWSDAESLARALREGRGIYHSRRRGLWRKGESSGNHQELLRVDLDCDRDALRFVVRQHGAGFCHRDTWTCWGDGGGLTALTRRLATAAAGQDTSSYTRKLLADPSWLASKLREEAGELAAARSRAHVVAEAADLTYFTMVALQRAGASLAEVEAELDRRARRVRRRPGLAKQDESAEEAR